MRVAYTHIYRENKILCCKETNSPIVDNFFSAVTSSLSVL